MNDTASVYPAHGRTAWITAHRPPRRYTADPFTPHGVFRERERLASGEIVASGVALLTNRECPWRCLMCDLWKDTLRATVPSGAIAHQVASAVHTWSQGGLLPTQVKLYNSGSFFDPAAIPDADYALIAGHVAFARHVVVESHPRLVIGERLRRLRDLLAPATLEVAMGLETAHPDILDKLNKRFDLAQFARAAEFLAAEGVALRVFILVNPPFMDRSAGLEWAVKSAEFAFACRATAVSLIPIRTGNGAMDRLLASGELVLPTLNTLEAAQERVLAVGRGRVFVDTWDIDRLATCPHCFAARRQRLEHINLTQQSAPAVPCTRCERNNTP